MKECQLTYCTLYSMVSISCLREPQIFVVCEPQYVTTIRQCWPDYNMQNFEQKIVSATLRQCILRISFKRSCCQEVRLVAIEI